MFLSTVICIFFGSIIMVSSIISFHRLIKKCCEGTYKDDNKRNIVVFWLCLIMMCSFLAAYIWVLSSILKFDLNYIHFITVLIFFLSAVFIYLMVNALWVMKHNLSKKNNELMNLLVITIELKDIYTNGHSKHVCDVMEMFYKYLPVELQHDLSLTKLRDAALLHDIGKLGIPDAILNKPGKLSDEEWAQMREHPESGKKLLAKTAFEEISDWIFYHHEHFDGNGYYNLKGEEIPLEARLIAIADSFSALNTNRVYRKRFSYEKSIEIMQQAAGKQFDKQLLEYFKRIPKEELEKIYNKNNFTLTDSDLKTLQGKLYS